VREAKKHEESHPESGTEGIAGRTQTKAARVNYPKGRISGRKSTPYRPSSSRPSAEHPNQPTAYKQHTHNNNTTHTNISS